MKLDATTRISVTRLLPALLIVGLHVGASSAAEDDPAKQVTFDVATSACQRVQTTLKANGKLRTASSDEAQQTAIRVVGGQASGHSSPNCARAISTSCC